jgi:hypothetical protein
MKEKQRTKHKRSRFPKPDPAVLKYYAEQPYESGYDDPDRPIPDEIWDLMANEAQALERLERGMLFF